MSLGLLAASTAAPFRTWQLAVWRPADERPSHVPLASTPSTQPAAKGHAAQAAPAAVYAVQLAVPAKIALLSPPLEAGAQAPQAAGATLNR
jgi:hypothetical protein